MVQQNKDTNKVNSWLIEPKSLNIGKTTDGSRWLAERNSNSPKEEHVSQRPQKVLSRDHSIEFGLLTLQANRKSNI